MCSNICTFIEVDLTPVKKGKVEWNVPTQYCTHRKEHYTQNKIVSKHTAQAGTPPQLSCVRKRCTRQQEVVQDGSRILEAVFPVVLGLNKTKASSSAQPLHVSISTMSFATLFVHNYSATFPVGIVWQKMRYSSHRVCHLNCWQAVISLNYLQ